MKELKELTPTDIQVLINASVSGYNSLEAKVNNPETPQDFIKHAKDRMVEIQNEINAFERYMVLMCHQYGHQIRKGFNRGKQQDKKSTIIKMNK